MLVEWARGRLADYITTGLRDAFHVTYHAIHFTAHFERESAARMHLRQPLLQRALISPMASSPPRLQDFAA